MMTGPSIRLEGCRYSARWARSLQVWDVVVEPGEIALLHAPIGRGKSTFLRAAVGLERARWRHREFGPVPGSRGSVRFLGTGAGVSPFLTVGHHVAAVGHLLGVSTLRAAVELDRWGMAELVRRPGTALSMGEHRGVSLSVVLAGRPSVVVLDEPSLGLDARRQDLLVERLHVLAASGTAVLMSGHDRMLSQALDGRVIDGG